MADVIFIFIFLLPLVYATTTPPSLPPSSPPVLQPPPFQSHLAPPPLQITLPLLKPSPPPPVSIQPPPPPPSSPQRPPIAITPPQSPAREMPQERMKNILEALIGSGDYANWGKLLTTADPTLLPFTSTLFVPNNDVVLTSFGTEDADADAIDPFLFLYHIVPHRLTFADLCLFATNTRLPTLLPTKSILVTNGSSVNFSIDGARVTDPDLYSTDSVTIHGIGGLLDYQRYGGEVGIEGFPWMSLNVSQNQNQNQNQGAGGLPKMEDRSKGGILLCGFGFLSLIMTLSSALVIMG